MKVEEGSIVKLEYTGKYENGEVFDTSDEEVAKKAGIYNEERVYEPITVRVGAGEIIPGIEESLKGMEVGEEKKVTLPPEKAYGEVYPDLVQNFPIQVFEQSEIQPEVGMIVRTPQGQAVITKVSADEVVLDFNHPLAGKTLIFEIKVADVQK